jgi:hypothetical protein
LIPHIRSLYIPYIADHLHGNNIDPQELAYQILDIVHLRPEIEICYMGISTKCFEILENRPTNYDLRHDGVTDGPTGGMADGYAPHDPLMSDDESEATEDEDEDDLDGGVGTAGDPEDSDSEVSDEAHDDSDDDSCLHDERKGPKLRVREIVRITLHPEIPMLTKLVVLRGADQNLQGPAWDPQAVMVASTRGMNE